jgi:hypothetical protein
MRPLLAPRNRAHYCGALFAESASQLGPWQPRVRSFGVRNASGAVDASAAGAVEVMKAVIRSSLWGGVVPTVR